MVRCDDTATDTQSETVDNMQSSPQRELEGEQLPSTPNGRKRKRLEIQPGPKLALKKCRNVWEAFEQSKELALLERGEDSWFIQRMVRDAYIYHDLISL
jgi:hypothetical protein